MSTLSTTPLSLYTIPAAWLLSIAPHWYAVTLYQRATGRKFDNTQPRSLPATVHATQSLPKDTRNRIIRAEGAQQNGFENIGLFAAGVVAGNVAGVDTALLNGLAGGYLLNRVVYNLVYINNESLTAANLRSVCFVGGVGLVWAMFIAAGNAFRRAAVVV